MKILYVSKADIPSSTANSYNIMSSCAAMAQLGHKVTLCAPKPNNRSQNDPFSFYGVPANFSLAYLSSPSFPGGRSIYCHNLKNYAHRSRPDLIFGRYRRGLLALARKGWPVVLEMHTIIRKGDRRPLQEIKSLTQSSGFTGLVTLTQTMAAHFHQLPLPALRSDRLWVAPCGGDPKTTTKPVPLPRYTSGWQVGYTGTLGTWKGLGLIQTIAQALTNHDFHIVGGNKQQIQEWRQKMPWPHVHFHGFIPPHKITSYISALDVCLLPNQQTPWNKQGEIITSPLKLFDYMAMGKAIIASDFEEIREVISDHEAIILPSDQPQEWIKTIDTLSREILYSKGDLARQRFVAQYTRNKRYNWLLDTIKKTYNY